MKPLWEEKIQCEGGGGGGVEAPSGAAGGLSSDFESLVMRKLRQEEESKGLIQKIMEEEEG